MGAIVVVTTVGTEEQAYLIGRELVARRLAACVNVQPGVRSIYRWQGKVQRDEEHLLIIKAKQATFAQIQERVRELHSYDTPEVIALPITAGSRKYLDWLEASSA